MTAPGAGPTADPPAAHDDRPAADDDGSADGGHGSWDPLTDYPVGPDDAGNAVLHAVGAIGSAWRWFVSKLRQ